MKLLLTVIIAFFCLSAIAQTPDIAIAEAIYEFTHVRDTNKRTQPYKENMVLLLSKNSSVYKSLDKQINAEKMAKDMADQLKNAPNPNALVLNITGPAPSLEEEYYLYPKDRKMLVEEHLINYYIIDEPFPVMKWKVRKDTMSIGTLHCQKATTHFAGRDYEAWFAPTFSLKAAPGN